MDWGWWVFGIIVLAVINSDDTEHDSPGDGWGEPP